MPNFCQANPSSIKPDPDNCARYYNCSQLNSTLGSYKMECPYPDLFSVATLRCQQFDTVTCTTRKEPKAPCKLTSLCQKGILSETQENFLISRKCYIVKRNNHFLKFSRSTHFFKCVSLVSTIVCGKCRLHNHCIAV